jgi:phosphosulfolactate phosphohydrolase-like enzyme
MIDVAVTRAELRSAGVAVVIDVLRAISTVTQALAAGYRSVLCTASVARASACALRDASRPVSASASRHPALTTATRRSRLHRAEVTRLVLATTTAPDDPRRGSARTDGVLACLLNLDAAIEALRQPRRRDEALRIASGGGGDVQIVCSGTNGVAALEDVYVAGRVSPALARAAERCRSGRRGCRPRIPNGAQALAASADAQVLAAASPGPASPTAPRTPCSTSSRGCWPRQMGSRPWCERRSLEPDRARFASGDTVTRHRRRLGGRQDDADARPANVVIRSTSTCGLRCAGLLHPT